jgi:hypothetical protein
MLSQEALASLTDLADLAAQTALASQASQAALEALASLANLANLAALVGSTFQRRFISPTSSAPSLAVFHFIAVNLPFVTDRQAAQEAQAALASMASLAAQADQASLAAQADQADQATQATLAYQAALVGSVLQRRFMFQSPDHTQMLFQTQTTSPHPQLRF